ncbi:hypothetical protein TNCV_1854311 [Trichonephila clavipes]|nr:hypothetical protein TNCV_1854311 [Trichonephila clavipes]
MVLYDSVPSAVRILVTRENSVRVREGGGEHSFKSNPSHSSTHLATLKSAAKGKEPVLFRLYLPSFLQNHVPVAHPHFSKMSPTLAMTGTTFEQVPPIQTTTPRQQEDSESRQICSTSAQRVLRGTRTRTDNASTQRRLEALDPYTNVVPIYDS